MLHRGSRAPELFAAMAGSLHHRGPDGSGVWSDPDAGVALVHRRLSIIDLSEGGHQPMFSADGRYVLAYNGEIYNHAELRKTLDPDGRIAWRGHSDTEVLLEAIAAWGLDKALGRAVGMFAVALWDRHERRLSLARDRFGEKPLYYGWVGGDFVFASELRAIRLHPRFDNPVSRRALDGLFANSYVGGPLSIFERLFKLEPGCILDVPEGGWHTPQGEPPAAGAPASGVSLRRYWSYRDVVRAGLADPIADEEEALARLEEVLGQAIRAQAVADVPVGAFLSGGIDSSTIVALYQHYWPGQVKTFTIGFDDAAYNEAHHAKQFAALLGTEHEERYVTPADAQAAITRMPDIYDEPFGDSSQVPTFLVSALARERVTVALSGDGGDELFGGYNRYFGTIRLWSALKRLPDPVRRGVGQGIGLIPADAWNALAALSPAGRRPEHFGNRVQKVFRTIGTANTLDQFVSSFLDDWARGRSPVLAHGGPPRTPLDLSADLGPGVPDTVAMMYADATSYMRDDILCKVDRAAMAVSLETRVPFLDHRVAELAARIPVRMKISGGRGKQILRKLLYRNAPAEMFERPKTGFAIPVGEWLRGPLRDWAETLLDPVAMRGQGYLDVDAVQKRWQAHLGRRQEATSSLWTVLMFQAWLARGDTPVA